MTPWSSVAWGLSGIVVFGEVIGLPQELVIMCLGAVCGGLVAAIGILWRKLEAMQRDERLEMQEMRKRLVEAEHEKDKVLDLYAKLSRRIEKCDCPEHPE